MTMPFLKIASNFKPFFAMLTGGAFVSFAGGALVLFYFLGIGGIPIGQASSSGAISKVVVPLAIILGSSFLMIWLVPTIISFSFLDEPYFSKILRQFFIPGDESREDANRTIIIAPNVEDTWNATQEKTNFNHSEKFPITLPTTVLPSHSPVLGLRIALFSLSTVGMGCSAVILYALVAVQEWSDYAGWIIFSGWVLAVCAFLMLMWCVFNTPWQAKNPSKMRIKIKKLNFKNQGENPLSKLNIIPWILFGIFSSAVSTAPLLALLLAFLRSDYLLETESFTVFLLGAFAISACIVLVYFISLCTLIEKIRGRPIKWGLLLAVNASILGLIVVILGLSSRMLEAVMIMASVRVESAFITLEPEGCELLQAMGAKGWGYPSKSTKLCVLSNVTIQSTLEPAMQIACWRGIIPKKKTQKNDKNTSNRISTSNPNQGHIENKVSSTSLNSAASSDSAKLPIYSSNEVTGERGAFTIPVKHVRSIWKTGGAKISDDKALCPTHTQYQNPQGLPHQSQS